MLQELSKAFVLIFSAEMGDKSQLLALAFATRYPMKKVLAGMFLGILINHSMAVFLGSLFSRWLDPVLIRWLAGLAFVGFALWTLKADQDTETDAPMGAGHGAVVTIALAFFLGELGDKTQLSAITLAAQSSFPVAILAGTMSAMLLTGLIGIVLGKKLGKQIPELYIKSGAALIFALFGWMKLYPLMPTVFSLGALSLFALLFLRLAYQRVQFARSGQLSAFARKAEQLRLFYEALNTELDQTCLHCPACEQAQCYVGYTKQVIATAPGAFQISPAGAQKRFDVLRLERLRGMTRQAIKDNPHEAKLTDILDKLEHMPGK